ncbi:hypothetical protein RFI_12751 [Reticulomyxa filosa]|uniref:Uncharacterized protein n=1 Tax=Reticulomyxa filosa TaxID=46433 RepID=X6NDM7_RETFI|nr:hypothetical protein RFI_12751 [Reticulomyxa filosa]|eukprot:ETO24405.1 hypothetical protein RFI_12751 [Reticulomyxa filosa]
MLPEGHDFANPVQLLLVQKARARLKIWRNTKAKEIQFKNFQKSKKSQTFHTVYAMRRPLKGHSVFYHWALVFEGTMLLRVEFFDDNKIHYILTQERRSVWFDVNDNYTKRWSVIASMPAIRRKEVLSVPLVGWWLQYWIKRKSMYSSYANNCQHFVRDIVAHFNTITALDLNGYMDAQVGSAFIPGMMVSHNMSQFASTFDEWNKGKQLECITSQEDAAKEKQIPHEEKFNNYIIQNFDIDFCFSAPFLSTRKVKKLDLALGMYFLCLCSFL